MAVVPDDFDKIEKAVNDGSGQVRALWFSFLGFETYLAVAAGSVTHRMLLEGTALKLPILNVDLPIFGFFVIAPVSLLIFHFYLLLQMLTLARKIALYDDLLNAQVKGHGDREMVRRRLDLFPMVQVLAGTTEDRSPLNAFLLRTVVVVTTVIWPVVVFLLIQLAFLPYHSAPVTWLHRLSIVAALVLIALLWPSVQKPTWRLRTGTAHVDLRPWALRLCYAIVVAFSVLIASFPGEWIGAVAGPLPELVLQGPINDATGRPVRPFSNVLVLTGEKFVDDSKLANQDRSISLRGRDLSGAIFVRADLRKADFTGANLSYAVFSHAKLTEAKFGCADRVYPKATEVGMFGPLRGINDKPAVYSWPADHCTWLVGALLLDADLRGADLSESRAQGANFARARMEGAKLQGADLTGAMFFGTRLDAASLDAALLYGALFNSARLRGASLVGAHLEGAAIFQVDFTAAALREAYVYRTYSIPKSLDLADLDRLERDVRPFGDGPYKAWLDKILARVPTGAARDQMRQRLSMLDADDKNTKIEIKSLTPPETWWEFTPQGSELEEPLSVVLCNLACKADDAPYVPRGLIANERLMAAGKHLPVLATRLRNPKLCPGAAGLGAADWMALDRLIDELKSKPRPKLPGFN